MRLPGVGGVLYMVQLQREISGFFPSYIARPRFGLQGLGFEGCGRSGLQAYQLHVLAKCGIPGLEVMYLFTCTGGFEALV